MRIKGGERCYLKERLASDIRINQASLGVHRSGRCLMTSDTLAVRGFYAGTDGLPRENSKVGTRFTRSGEMEILKIQMRVSVLPREE
jgi:hypothetical protein